MQWWQWILVVAGGFVLGMIILIYAVWTYIKYKLGKWGSSFGAAIKAMAYPTIPQSCTLIPPTEAVEANPRVDVLLNQFRTLGFEVGGPFALQEGPGIIVYTLADPSRELSGMVSQPPKGLPVIDIVTLYEDGSAITHGTLADQGFEYPPTRRMVRIPGASPEALLQRHLADRPERERRRVELSEVPQAVNAYTEEVYFWRALRGGLTSAEMERQFEIARSKETGNDDPESRNKAEQMLRDMIRSQAAEYLRERFHNQFLKESTLSAQQWQEIENRLVLVFDSAEPEPLAYYLHHPTETDSEEAKDMEMEGIKLKLMTGPLRQAFSLLNNKLPPNRRLKLIGHSTISNPLAEGTADIYVSPEEEGV